ncbi:RNP domain-containing protein [Encephalitozoon cuniculi EcunIII-L]|uniref:RRM domain-containing protein n=1 Tax=Encephalitozoon cuniculi TaxID=6035 RepID=M1K705_ENCCN|nr:hypothetical protein ECU11_0500 [Encephalitozoon cuniculi]KMV65006.1 RNP domain-containing protein [Encephalitozoon cuniculi EcunIII-L]UYI26248.1 polyadenylate binding protein [Encephalitozoon cuniculi]
MDFDEDTLFVGSIPSSFSNELLMEILNIFGEVREFRRGRSLEGADSPWAIVNYHEPASANRLYGVLLNRALGESRVTILPARKGFERWENSGDVLKKIEDINRKYREELEREDLLDRFISSYNLLYGKAGDDRVFSFTLKKWLKEEAEIRKRCRKAEHDFEKSTERRRQEEYDYLSNYDDDRSNDLFYLDRTSWISERNKDNVK